MPLQRPPHPGTIVFEDQAHGTVEIKKVSELPEAIAYVQVKEVLVPVARICARMRGDQRILQSYDAQGRLLQTTLQLRDAKK